MRRLLLAIALSLPVAAIPLTGCAHNVNAATPSTVQKAAIVLDDITVVVNGAQQGETITYNSGQISAADHKAISQAFVTVADKEIALANLMKAGASQADVQAAANALVNEIKVGISNGSYNIKNPTTAANINALVSTVQLLVNQLLVAYGG